MAEETSNRPFRMGELHPDMVGPIMSMTAAVNAAHITIKGERYVFQPFEGLRLPMRQYHLFTVAKTTKARPWQSAHQYGLAVDFACRKVDNKKLVGWYWPEEADWEFLSRLAANSGLRIPIKWDRGHVEHPKWTAVRAASLK